MFFDNWWGLLRVAVSGFCAYVSLVFLLRTTGKRALSKMNAFDFVVTVALGSVLASILRSKDTALVEGILAFAVLLFLQYAVAWLAVRSRKFNRVIKSTPALLVYRDELLQDAMKAERVNDEEILAAMRSHGASSLHEIAAVVLEADGSFSVLEDLSPGQGSAFKEVANLPSNRHTFSNHAG
jgi:uncharacterized membrane protein YcaP (DUF421 family)